MATLILSAAGAAAGGTLGGGLLGFSGAVVGRAVGAATGNLIDQQVMGAGSTAVSSGRTDAFRVMSGAEGAAVPQVFGTARLGGQVIWASKFREETSTSGGGKNRPKVTEYTYSVSLAVALCEGPIERIGRVWADGNEIALDTVNWRLHRGTEDQVPDAMIEAIEGIGQVPAYRGIAYVVFEDLPLGNFGHRVPQFNFEVVRRVSAPDNAGNSLDPFSQVEAVALVPGTGEYALSTQKVHLGKGIGAQELINVNNSHGAPDFSVSMDNLDAELPQVSSVSLVVGWFGTDLRCSKCAISPRVERHDSDGIEMPWRVSGVSRSGAPLVSQIDSRPAFGGTPADQSVVQAIEKINADGKSVMFYPFMLMDIPAGNLSEDPWTGGLHQPAFPWRGRITLDRASGVAGSADKTFAAKDEVDAFFGAVTPADFHISNGEVVYSGPPEWSYRRFILHYAHLCALAGGVGAFCIGSEMRALTQLRDASSSFPAVTAFVSLAADVRTILGANTKITYAADWSEYFGYHPQDGSGDLLFHLDELWASPDIDVIGIDNYMPISDWRDGINHADAAFGSVHNLDYLSDNIAGGEGFDWFYASQADRELQIRSPITDGAYGEPWVFRYKDLLSWWSMPHFNRIGGVRVETQTAWVPQSKPFWFTELGCPAIDKGTNQPNVFIDEKSSESELPHYSSGARDDYIQHQYLAAQWRYWSDNANNPVSVEYNEPMVDMSRAHVWAWDARPWPEFPDRLSVWSDGDNYGRGHWITGRLNNASVAGIVGEMAERAGFSDYDVSKLDGSVQGFVVEDVQTVRQSLQPLMLSQAFDAYETDGKIVFKNRGQASVRDVATDGVTEEEGRPAVVFNRAAASSAPQLIQVDYIQGAENYQTAASVAGAPLVDDVGRASANLPIVMSNSEGTAVATRWLSEANIALDQADVTLPPSAIDLTPGDVISLEHGGLPRLYRIDRIEEAGVRRLKAVRVEQSVYETTLFDERDVERPTYTFPTPAYAMLLDLPIIKDEVRAHAPYLALTSVPWLGRHSVFSGGLSSDVEFDGEVSSPSVIGSTNGPLKSQTPGLWASGGGFEVTVASGELTSRTKDEVLAGANTACLRAPGAEEWEIFQFQTATMVGENTYALDGLLRGQYGTDAFIPDFYPLGSDFVLLDPSQFQSNIPAASFGADWRFRIGPSSRSIDDDSYVSLTQNIKGAGLRPLAPVHLEAFADGSSGYNIQWVRRTRINGDNWMGADVPLGEDTEKYVLRVIKPGAIVPEREISEPEFHYASSIMASEGITTPFEIEVAQLSQVYGYGPFKRIKING